MTAAGPPDDATTSERSEPARILLVGMMGAGKTAVGRELARRTGWQMVDNDDLVRQMTSREPAAIAADDGDDALHDVEAAALSGALALAPPVVIGVAGAMVERPGIRATLRLAGHVVWLRARPETLRARIGEGADRRSEAVDLAWLTSRAAEREPLYRDVADQVIDVDDIAPETIASAILGVAGIPSAG
jgi:shikimate kinase